jgi:hypothetical protein
LSDTRLLNSDSPRQATNLPRPFKLPGCILTEISPAKPHSVLVRLYHCRLVECTDRLIQVETVPELTEKKTSIVPNQSYQIKSTNTNKNETLHHHQQLRYRGSLSTAQRAGHIVKCRRRRGPLTTTQGKEESTGPTTRRTIVALQHREDHCREQINKKA